MALKQGTFAYSSVIFNVTDEYVAVIVVNALTAAFESLSEMVANM